MKQKPRVDYVIVCDDIRNEIGNKNSYMGIYGDKILVKEFPYIFPRLCFAIKLSNFRKHTISLTLKYLDQEFKLIPKQEFSSPAMKGRADGFLLCGGIGPFSVQNGGTAKLTLTVNHLTYRHEFIIEKNTNPTIFNSSRVINQNVALEKKSGKK